VIFAGVVSRPVAEAFRVSERLSRDLWVLDAREQADAAEIYRKACAHLFDITLLSAAADFYNKLEGYQLGHIVFAHCVGVPQRFERKLTHIMGDATDTVMAVLDLEKNAWRADYEGRPASSDMGPIRLVDMARPSDLSSLSGYTTLYVIVPRNLLDPRAAAFDFHGRVAPEDSPTGRMLASHLRALWASIEAITPAEAPMAAKATAALVSGAILAFGEPMGADPRPLEKVLLITAQQFIEQRLDDPELSPEMVREHLGVSRSQLYKVFDPAGGVSAFIQRRRLDQAFDAILQDRTEQLTLAEVGYRHGFRSDAHFSRAFRARFGVTPGRLRKMGEAARQEGLSARERPDDVFAWFSSL
jgi:AraC-like DNA-binding protein